MVVFIFVLGDYETLARGDCFSGLSGYNSFHVTSTSVIYTVIPYNEMFNMEERLRPEGGIITFYATPINW